MRHLLIIISLSANAFLLHGQLPDSAVWSVDAVRFEVDKLQNIYLIDGLQNVRKRTPDGSEVFLYTNLELGALTTFDTTDPFNLLLYFPGYMTAVQLDRTLNERGRLAFPELGFPQVDDVAKSRDNQIWIYDGLRYRLLKINADAQVLAESQDLSLLPEGAPNPTQLIAAGNYVYLLDPGRGVLIFDAFGQYAQTVQTDHKKLLQTLGDQLLLRDGPQLYLLNGQGDLMPLVIPFSIPPTAELRIAKNHLLYLHGQELHIRRWRRD